MATYYRGDRSSVRSLIPQPLTEADRRRFPPEVDRVVFATDDKTEAQIYAAFSRRGMSGFMSVKDENGKWHVSIPLKQKEMRQLMTDHVYIYTIEDNEDRFRQPLEGDEFYSTEVEYPTEKQRISVKRIIEEWDLEGKVELHLREAEREIPRLKG